MPAWAFALPADQCRALLAGLQLAAGAPTKAIFTSSHRLRDEVRSVGVHAARANANRSHAHAPAPAPALRDALRLFA